MLSTILELVGFGLVISAASLVAPALGLLAAGVACVFLAQGLGS